MKRICNSLESGVVWCLMLSVSEACGSAVVVTSLSARGIVTSSSVHFDVRCLVRGAIVQWDAVESTVGGNACGWFELVVDTYGKQPALFLFARLNPNPISFHWCMLVNAWYN